MDGSPLMMGITTLRPGRTTPLIEHDTAELAYVLSGSGWMVTDTSEHPFEVGDAVLIDARCWHAIRAGADPVRMLYVFPTPTAPPTRTQGSQIP
ncbi:MAG: cupin domain-containing protein [Geodermatophilaceae bacterium]